MSTVNFKILPVTKEDLFEFYCVYFKARAESDWFIDTRFPPWLQQPVSCRPAPGEPAPYPPSEAVTLDRAKRQSAVAAEKFDRDVSQGVRYLKLVIVGGDDCGKVVGIAKWTPPSLWESHGAATVDDGPSKAYKDLYVIHPSDCYDEINKKEKEIKDSVLPGGSAWVLDHLMILPEYQGKGLGNILMEEGMGYITAHDPKPCFLESAPGAVDYYKKHGFELVGQFEVGAWKGGVAREGEEVDIFTLNYLVKW